MYFVRTVANVGNQEQRRAAQVFRHYEVVSIFRIVPDRLTQFNNDCSRPYSAATARVSAARYSYISAFVHTS
jgi:hypothetical protein